MILKLPRSAGVECACPRTRERALQEKTDIGLLRLSLRQRPLSQLGGLITGLGFFAGIAAMSFTTNMSIWGEIAGSWDVAAITTVVALVSGALTLVPGFLMMYWHREARVEFKASKLSVNAWFGRWLSIPNQRDLLLGAVEVSWQQRPRNLLRTKTVDENWTLSIRVGDETLIIDHVVCAEQELIAIRDSIAAHIDAIREAQGAVEDVPAEMNDLAREAHRLARSATLGQGER